MARVMRLKGLCGPRQVKVEQPRHPEAQGGGLQNSRPGLLFFWCEGPHAGIGVQPGTQGVVVEDAGVAVNTPVVDTDRYVEQPGVPAGEVKVDERTEEHTSELQSLMR